jgi:hypothetical protein
MPIDLLLAAFGAAAPGPAVLPPPPGVKAVIAWELTAPNATLLRAGELSFDDAASPRQLLFAFDDRLQVRSAESGALVWERTDLPGAGLVKPDPERRYLTRLAWVGPDGRDGWRVLGVAASDGATQWECVLEQEPTAPPTWIETAEDRVGSWYVPLASGEVMVFAGDGEPRERILTGARPQGEIARLADRAVGLVGQPARLVDLRSPAGGGAPREISPDTLGTSGRLLAAGQGAQLTVWRCRSSQRSGVSCRRRWSQRVGSELRAAPLFDQARLILGARDGHAYAFRSDNGHLLWRTSIPGRVSMTPLRWQELLMLAPERSPRVLFLRLDDGIKAGELTADHDEIFDATPILAGDLVITSVALPKLDSPRALRAYRLERVEPVRRPDQLAPPSPPTADKNRSSSRR